MNTWLPALTMGIGRIGMNDEERLASHIIARNAIIEECARIIEQCRTDMIYKLDAAAAIRALKDKL